MEKKYQKLYCNKNSKYAASLPSSICVMQSIPNSWIGRKQMESVQYLDAALLDLEEELAAAATAIGTEESRSIGAEEAN